MNGAAGAECLDQLFGAALATHSTMELLQLIERFEAEMRSSGVIVIRSCTQLAGKLFASKAIFMNRLPLVTRPAIQAVTMALWNDF